MTREIPPPDKKHCCDLGGAATVPEGTMRRCTVCGRWSRSVQTYRFWTESEWLRVRWWQWRLRRRIAQYVKPWYA